MKRTIHCIIDSSGSMTELGKSKILRNTVKLLANTEDDTKHLPSEYEIKFYTWRDSIQKLKLEAYSKFPRVKFSGRLSMIPLLNFFDDVISKEGELSALLLSDGNISRRDINTFSEWLDEKEHVKTVCVGIGADYNLLKLEKLSSLGKVYYCDDVSIAVKALLFGSNHKARPIGIEQLQATAGSK